MPRIGRRAFSHFEVVILLISVFANLPISPRKSRLIDRASICFEITHPSYVVRSWSTAPASSRKFPTFKTFVHNGA
jgi:hypothetical protein